MDFEVHNFGGQAADMTIAVGTATAGQAIGKGVSKIGSALSKEAGVIGRVVPKTATKSSFFEGTKYTDKVRQQMKSGDYHSFPESVKAFESSGTVSPITGRDGVSREMLKIPGSYDGKSGYFEFIKEADGAINHRFFNSN